jgi:uncharacterized Zn ribbon protein
VSKKMKRKPKRSIGRVLAQGDTVYIVGDPTVFYTVLKVNRELVKLQHGRGAGPTRWAKLQNLVYVRLWEG